MGAHHQPQAVPRSGRLDPDLQLAEHPQARGPGDLDPESEHRIQVQRAAGSSLGQRVASQSNQRASLSYVTGSHAFKVGFTTQEAWHHAWYSMAVRRRAWATASTSYTFFNNAPQSLTQYAEPVTFDERLKVNLGLYVQDQWTLKRVTLNLGLRYDYFNAYVPEQNLNAGPFVPGRNYDQVDVCRAGRTSARAWPSPTTCSRTARPRSRPTLAASSRRTSTRWRAPTTR